MTDLIDYLKQIFKRREMIKKKATKKLAKKTLKTTSYTRVAPNIYKDVCGSYCVRKMVDGVRYSKSTNTIKEAKTYLNSL